MLLCISLYHRQWLILFELKSERPLIILCGFKKILKLLQPLKPFLNWENNTPEKKVYNHIFCYFILL